MSSASYQIFQSVHWSLEPRSAPGTDSAALPVHLRHSVTPPCTSIKSIHNDTLQALTRRHKEKSEAARLRDDVKDAQKARLSSLLLLHRTTLPRFIAFLILAVLPLPYLCSQGRSSRAARDRESGDGAA